MTLLRFSQIVAGCVKNAPVARGVQNAGITQPIDHYLADRRSCNWHNVFVECHSKSVSIFPSKHREVSPIFSRQRDVMKKAGSVLNWRTAKEICLWGEKGGLE